MNSGADRASGELRVALRTGIARLEQCNVPSAPLAAELLLMHVLRRDRAWLYAHPEYELSPEEAGAYSQLVERRSKGVPPQYLTGRQEFWGLEIEVGPGVLIPRPETEHVIEVALALGKGARRFLDVGCGSGAIAITLQLETGAEVWGTDISLEALKTASDNASRLGAHVSLVASDLESAPLNFATTHLGPAGWSPGKHGP